MSEEMVDLGHNGNESLRVDGLSKCPDGNGQCAGIKVAIHHFHSHSSSSVKKSLKTSTAMWIPKRIVDIVAEQSTQERLQGVVWRRGCSSRRSEPVLSK
jgi:hypothetical protein